MNRTLAAALLASAALAAPGVLHAEDVASNAYSPSTAYQSRQAPASFAGTLPGADGLTLDRPVYAADDATAQPAAAAEPAAAAPAAPGKKVSGSVGATLTTKYISRGLILNNDRGIIVQPFAEIDFDLYSSKTGFINSIAPYVGIWNDLTSDHRFAGANQLRTWYEFDWDVGVSISFLNNWNFNVQYIEFTSPNGAFGTAKNIIPQLTFDDSSLWGENNPLAFALHPYVAGLIETHGKAGSGATLGQYIEPGLNPSVTFGATGDLPITVTVPLKVGLGFNNFYGGSNPAQDQTFGYASAGVQIALPVKFIDATLGGSWSLSAGAAYYYYAGGTHAFNASVDGYTSRHDVIGSIGLLCKF